LSYIASKLSVFSSAIFFNARMLDLKLDDHPVKT
jgi:hypothetical protein